MSLERMPRVGERVRLDNGGEAEVTEVKDDGIVWVRYLDGRPGINGRGATCFIGKFSDGSFNKLTTLVKP